MSPRAPCNVGQRAQRAPPVDRADKILKCFKTWDTDGKGYITKCDLRDVLQKLFPEGSQPSGGELEKLMVEADRNGNGKIEYHEFTEWLARPGSSIHAGAQDISYFDLNELLRPLFDIYDRNGDGTISTEEFAECHNIMRTALTLHPSANMKSSPDPEHVVKDSGEVFDQVDQDRDQRLSFQEFVEWQRGSLEKSGLLNDDLVELVPALARQMTRVFRMAEITEQGEPIDNVQSILMHIMKNLAMLTRDIYNTDQAGRNSLRGHLHYTNRWSDPPPGISIDRLKGLHLSTRTIPLWGVNDTDLAVLCIPEVELRDIRHRRWLAKIERRVTYRTGRLEKDGPYFYVHEDSVWTQRRDLGEEWAAAYEALPPELRIFCHLKSMVNLGVRMNWEQLQAALRECVTAELLTEAQVTIYNDHVEEAVVKAMREHGAGRMENKDKCNRIRALAKQAPGNVMALLAELGILTVSSAWAYILEDARF